MMMTTWKYVYKYIHLGVHSCQAPPCDLALLRFLPTPKLHLMTVAEQGHEVLQLFVLHHVFRLTVMLRVEPTQRLF